MYIKPRQSSLTTSPWLTFRKTLSHLAGNNEGYDSRVAPFSQIMMVGECTFEKLDCVSGVLASATLVSFPNLGGLFFFHLA